MAQHRSLHQGVAGTDGHAMPAGNAARLANRRSTIPQHTWVRVFPSDRECFVYFEVLTGLDTTAAKDALVRVITIERICIVRFVWLRLKRNALMFDTQEPSCVVDRTVAVTVIADCAVEKMVAK